MEIKENITAVFLATVMGANICCAQTDGLKIHDLGTRHSLIQVTEPKKYLLLPVEEAAPEASVRVLVNNECIRTLGVRLALSRTDYFVPFDLTPCQGKAVAFDILTPDNRSEDRDGTQDVYLSALRLSDTFDTANREVFRPLYHHTPLWGWMNDPNGMFCKDGEYHLYFQYNPYGSMWGNMHWGHVSSKDLVTWERHPVAIAPDGLGTVFSGNCVVDKNNTAGFGKDAVVAIYTSAGTSQIQSLAYSTDNGETFRTYAGNPVITADRECRDPNVFWHEETGKWVLVLASPLEREVWIYSSDDLKNWRKESSFGQGYGDREGVWECPDLFELPVRGTGKTKWVLVCNTGSGGPSGGSATQYFVGDFDGKTFTCDTRPEVTKWLDYGKDHYAAVSWSNAPEDRRIVIAWMSNGQYAGNVPTRQFRSADTLPRDLELRDDGDGYYAAVVPSPETEALRTDKVLDYGSFSVSAKNAARKLPAENSGVCEIDLTIENRAAEKVNITLSNAGGEKVVMTYDKADNTFSMDRTQSGLTDFSRDFPSVSSAPVSTASKQHLRLFIDRCSIEAFGGDGCFAMTNLVFPKQPYTDISVSTSGGRCKIDSLRVYPLKPCCM